MAIDLYFSNHLEALADKLGEVLSLERRQDGDPFALRRVIVPNANLTRWLQLRLAARQMVLMHVHFQYLEAGLWQLLAAIDGQVRPVRLMDKSLLQVLLLQVLEGVGRADPVFAPVVRYLAAGASAEKRWQLAGRLAQLFQEYAFNRLDMIQSWRDPGYRPRDAMEACQRGLYLALERLGQTLAAAGEALPLSALAYAATVLDQAGPAAYAGSRPRVHCFGLSQISPFHLQCIGRLQAHYDFCIYALNPSREFWEDVRTPGESAWERRRQPALRIAETELITGELAVPAGHRLLSLWGKPGRENLRLLCELTDYAFHACYRPLAPEGSVLARIQHDLLTLDGGAARDPLPQDRSLQIVGCPSRVREVQTVYHSILANLDRDPVLQLTDIAVLVPDMSAYKPVFDAVFTRSPRALAFNLVDCRADIESLFGQAVLHLLQMTTERFSRRAVFALLLNPCFMARWRIDADTVQTWARWAEALGVFHGFDGHDKAQHGGAASANYTWKLALQRLRLARILDTGVEAPDGGGFAGREPYADTESDADTIERFCLAIEALQQAVTRLKGGVATGSAWRQRLFEVCDRLLAIPDDRRGEDGIRRALLEAFERLCILERLPQPVHLDTAFIRSFVRSELSAISGGYGDYLTGGVTVSALMPMRPIPFRVVYILGLEEGGFPGRAETDSLDLRLTRRRIGDVSLPERNCYLFLELLVAVREKLYLSYIARDLQKDRELQPCAVVNQLKRHVEQTVLPPGTAFAVTTVPLKASAPAYHTMPVAEDAVSDLRVNYAVTDRLTCYRAQGLWEPFLQEASPVDRTRAETAAAPWGPPPEAPPHLPSPDTETVTCSQLSGFLRDPIGWHVRRHLGLFDPEAAVETVADTVDEPFFSGFPVDYQIQRDVLRLWVAKRLADERPAATPAAVFEAVYGRYARCSRTPEGVYADIDRQQLLTRILDTVPFLEPIIAAMRTAARRLPLLVLGEVDDPRIGPPPGPGARRFDAVPLNLPLDRRIGVTAAPGVVAGGALPWLWQSADDASWHVLVVTGGVSGRRQPDKYLLEPVLFQMLWSIAAGADETLPGSRWTLHRVYPQNLVEDTFEISADRAGTYLANLAADYLDRAPPGWLLFETIAANQALRDMVTAPRVHDGDRRLFSEALAAAFEEEADARERLVAPTFDLDLLGRARRRFGIFFELVDEKD